MKHSPPEVLQDSCFLKRMHTVIIRQLWLKSFFMNNTTPAKEAFLKANRLLENNQLVEAEAIFQQLLSQYPKHHGAMHGLGLIAFKCGKTPMAIQLIVKAIRLNGDVGIYHRNLGEIFRINNQLDKAILAGQNATSLMPDDATAFYNLGLAYASNGKNEDAIICYTLASKLDTTHVMSLNNMGNLYAEQGNMAEARRCFNEAIKRKPDCIDAHFNLSALKTYTADDIHLTLLESLEKHSQRFSEQSQSQLGFILGKAYEDIGNYAAAFSAYKKGNDLYSKAHPYNEQADIKNHHAIKSVFNADFMQRHQGLGANDTSAIFIIGMPRSGTTLVEQILSSHSLVYGAGEIKSLSQVMDEFSAPASLFYPQKLQDSDYKKLGEAYSQKIEALAPETTIRYISNKTPNNFLHLGLIKLILPNAKIIHLLRDPMDVCLSCYSRYFTESVDFTSQLEELGRYYVRYREMMQYWESVLPANSVYTVQYENVARDLETETRKLLDFIGLEWEDSCLNFQDNQRKVNTASIAQVRKPIYTSSIARWERFSEELQPLMEIVKDWR
jgi:tetratricopeptide (TPR) repeat protein